MRCCGEGRRCEKQVSPFRGTFFDGDSCRIPTSKVLELVYHFILKTPVVKASAEVEVSTHTGVDYYHFCRELCTMATEEREDNIIGGPGLTVEIDESKFFSRKYNRGRITRSQKDGWVFGGICRETKEIFMVRVPDRSKATLVPIVIKHIRHGSIIMSDEWRAYVTLADQGYEHHTICHKYNFVDPDDDRIHTQNIECRWRYAKQCYPRNSTSNDLRESYLQEYLYRNKHGKNMKDQLLADMKKYYPFTAKPKDEVPDYDSDFE